MLPLLPGFVRNMARLGPVIGGVCFSGFLPVRGETAGRIDFARDIQPLFKAHCLECHGPTKQSGDFRLDRRREALRGGSIAQIAPGSSEGSRLFHKLTGTEYGQQMPPDDPLKPEQIRLIQAWLDQGAVWPDELSGDLPAMPPDPAAARMMKALREGDQAAFERLLREDPQAVNRKGPGGATPLMQAVLYGELEQVRSLLAAGADVNHRNEAGATALMWAADDLEKTRLLLDRGADPEARTDERRTALQAALSFYASADVVKLLVELGDKPFPKSAGEGAGSLVNYAIATGDSAWLETLIERGAAAGGAGTLANALVAGDPKCAELILSRAGPGVMTSAAKSRMPSRGDATSVGTLLDRGADPNATDDKGRTLLMLAAHSDALPVETVSALLQRGASVNAVSPEGRTALDYARLRGANPIAELLVRAGAKEGLPFKKPSFERGPALPPRAAAGRSLPLLQRTDAVFIQKSGCVSCHHNSLMSMTLAVARANRLPYDDALERDQQKRVAAYLELWRERLLLGRGIPGSEDTVSYILLGLAAGNHPPDEATDAAARYLKGRQRPDGRWKIIGHRPPMESSDLQVTAASLRALQVYAPLTQRSRYDSAVRRGARWLASAAPRTLEDHGFRLLGLSWAGMKPGDNLVVRAAAALLQEQREDGGWPQLPGMPSDAYATGLALVALAQGGGLPATDSAFQRGVRFLLEDQAADGSWHVQSRSVGFQPFFESGFPYGHDQWISAAATQWAAMALLTSLPRE